MISIDLDFLGFKCEIKSNIGAYYSLLVASFLTYIFWAIRKISLGVDLADYAYLLKSIEMKIKVMVKSQSKK